MILMSGFIAGPAVSLYGVADCVAGNRRFVGFRPFATVMTVFYVFFGVIPSAAAVVMEIATKCL